MNKPAAHAWECLCDDRDTVVGIARCHAEAALPPATRYEIRESMPAPVGARIAIAWIAEPAFESAREWESFRGRRFSVVDGAWLLERGQTADVAMVGATG